VLSTAETKLKPTSSWSWFIDLIVITFVLGVVYTLWIGSHALFTPDEGRYSEVAREMVVTGDYITPRLNGVVFLDKPIFYYWLQASAIHLFGLKEWSLRFWPSLIGVLGCLATYAAGRVLFSRRAGILSALILATVPLYYGAAHYANLDLEVAIFITISLLNFILGLQTQRKIFYYIAYLFSGIAFLTKGLIGIFFPMVIVGSWIILTNRWHLIKSMRLGIGILIFLIITVPWYVLAQKANPQFFHFFFVTQQVSRFLTTADFNNKTSAWFYVPIVLAGGFPWAVFFFQSVYQKMKLVWQDRKGHSSELFLLLWFFLIFAFFSIPRSKTVGYILPVFPAFALLIGSYLDHAWSYLKSRGLRIGLIAYIVVCAILFISSIIVPLLHSALVPVYLNFYFGLSGAVFLLSGMMIAYLLVKKRSFPVMFGVLLATSIAFLFVIMASTPALNQKTVKPLAMEIKPYLNANDEIVTYYKYYQDLPIYLERRITIVADWDAADIPQNDNWVREMWYGMPFQNTKSWLIGEDSFWNKWNSDRRLFVLMNSSYFPDFSAKAKNKIYMIAQHNNIMLISNQELTKNPKLI
jgi:4-amino-4-deoxy-L-arabinose transferase-like glycosyltransferase